MDSILTSIKKMLGMTEDYTHFDPDIIMHINSAFMVLTQLGVGPPNGFRINDASSIWSDFVPEDNPYFGAIPTYVYQKVRLNFDPPSNSAVIDAMKRSIDEFEWRLNVAAEST